ncbi:hypothetical protein HY968_04580 [Candidatus Kaiserbacteria bacterium]|nr:hypothetical protein [Candidatus Kaiserbacteria bacterium]
MSHVETSTQPNGPVGTIAARIDAYLAEHGNLSTPGFAALCGVSASTLYKIRDGKKVHARSLERVEAVLEGRSQGEESTSSKSVLDPVSTGMANAVLDVATQNKRHLALVTECFRRLEKQMGPEAAESVAANVLWAFLAGIDDPEVRVKQLFELHEVVKED